MSRLHEIVASAHDQICRIDELERRADERSRRLRRRICNVIDSETKPYRCSHLRCFVTHSHNKNPTSSQEEQVEASANMSLDPNNNNGVWTLRLEGKLLIGHLDHASSAAHDKHRGYVTPTDDLDRSKGEKEEDEVLPIQFTHFFERVEVEFQTTYSPRPHPMAKKKPPPSKKRRSGTTKQSSVVDENHVDPRLLVVSAPMSMAWTRTASADAHAFDFQYEPPPPVEFRYQLHSVVAKIRLFSNQSAATRDPLYEISPELAKELFPKHLPAEPSEPASSTSMGAESKKRKAETEVPTASVSGPSGGGSSNNNNTPLPPPVEDEIHMTEGFTMRQIVMTFYTYIHDNRLCDEVDKSTIHCDEKLRNLFQLDQIAFFGLQNLLISKNLIKPMSNNPVKLTYIMKEDAATNYRSPPPPPVVGKTEEELLPASLATPSQLQLDMDVIVPSLFPFRAREILRRLKRRELEYTSSRTKARYFLMARRAKDEEDVKAMIDQVVSGHQLGKDYIPVFGALAKAAPPHTEARNAAHYDERLCYIAGKVQEHVAAAIDAWNKVGAAVQSAERNS